MSERFTLLTGAATDLGRALAIGLAPARRLLLGGGDRSLLEETRLACQDPARHTLWVDDLASAEAIGASLVGTMNVEGAVIQNLVHCCGGGMEAPMSAGALEKFIDKSVVSAITLVGLLSSRRFNRGALEGIVFVASLAGKIGIRGATGPAVCAGALEALTRSLAVELAPGIRVNCVMVTDFPPCAQPEEPAPLGQGRAADATGAVEFLLSPRARWITGQDLVVDGGRTII